MSSLSFAGVPLTLEDPGHEFQQFVERYFSFDDLRLFGAQTVAQAEGRTRPRETRYKYRVGLPQPNWSAPPKQRLNTLYIPNGASRFAVGLFLCGEADLAAILESIDLNRQALLEIYDKEQPDSAQRAVIMKMTLLPPRPINFTGGGGLNGYLLPLVDDRYWLQFADTGELTIEENTTWTSLIETLYSRLPDHLIGVFNEEVVIPEAYGYPDPIELTRRCENLGVMLDAVAACLGLQVSPYYAADINYNTWLSMNQYAAEQFPAFINGYWHTIAGAQSTASILVPAAVKVVFPIVDETGVPDEGGAVYTITRSAALYGPETATRVGTEKVFYDTAAAEVTGVSEGTPTNLEELTALADQIAIDFYRFAGLHYDIAYHGLVDRNLYASDDAMLIYCGCLPGPDVKFVDPYAPDGDPDEFPPRGIVYPADGLFYTRVWSRPFNFGWSELLHQTQPVGSSSDSGSGSTSSSSSDLNCQRVVKDVTFDEDTCELTVTYVWICGEGLLFFDDDPNGGSGSGASGDSDGGSGGIDEQSSDSSVSVMAPDPE